MEPAAELVTGQHPPPLGPDRLHRERPTDPTSNAACISAAVRVTVQVTFGFPFPGYASQPSSYIT